FAFSWAAFGHAKSSSEAGGLAQQYGGGGGWSFVRSATTTLWAQAGVLYGRASGTVISPGGAEGGAQTRAPYDLSGPVFLSGLVGKTKTAGGVVLSGQLYYFKALTGPAHQQLGTDNSIKIPLTGILSFTVRGYATTSARQTRVFEPKNLVVATGFSVSF